MAKPRFQIDLTRPEEPVDLISRADTRRATRVREEALERLARDLTSLRDGPTERLGLPVEVLDAVRDARAITSRAAKQRQIRQIRNLLRASEWAQIRVKLDALRVHGVVPDADRVGEESAWAVRLLGEGDGALTELLRDHPKADRGHLRALVRNVQRATAGRRQKAELALAEALRRMLRG